MNITRTLLVDVTHPAPRLHGVTLAQTTLYYRWFPGDARGLKFMVSFLFVIDTLHVYLLCSLFWQITVIGHMIYDTAQPMPWPLMGSFIVSFVVTFVVQAFFCLRIWRFGHKYRIVAGIIAVTALSQIGGGWAFAIPNITNKLLKEVSLVPFQIELVSSLLCDVAISSSLIYYFRTNRGIHRRFFSSLFDTCQSYL